MNRLLLFLSLALLAVAHASAVDTPLYANNINKHLYVYQPDDYIGFGWQEIANEPESAQRIEQRYLDAGYTYTESPYELEYSGVIALLFALAVFWFIRRGINLLRRF